MLIPPIHVTTVSDPLLMLDFFQELDKIELSQEEIGPLAYVCGYVLQSLYRKSKNSKHWNSVRSRELQFLLQSLKLAETKDDEYIHSLSRGGLWAQNEAIKSIAKMTEIMFRQYLKSQKAAHLSVPTEKIVDQVLATPDVKSLWESIIAELDSQVSNECSKLALENFIKLYVQVRSFSHARDIVNKYKLKEKALKKKALRKELKKADTL